MHHSVELVQASDHILLP